MDKEYMVKHNLMEAHKQFMRLSEGYLATSLVEDDEESQEDTQSNTNQEPMNNTQEVPDTENSSENNVQNDMEGDDGPQMGNSGFENNFEEGPDMDMDTDNHDAEADDDVLDVEDLTQAQEKLNKKQNSIGHDLGEVDDRIISLLTAVEKIQGSIEKNNNDITALKRELEKRVPTDTEKLNMQSLKMYPFNVSPNEYWKDKEKDGRYEAENKDKEQVYKITRDDVDDYADRDIENSFDDELNQTMKDIFKGF